MYIYVICLLLLLLLSRFSRVRLLATPWTAAHQAPPSMGFSRQEYWSGVPLPSPVICLQDELSISAYISIVFYDTKQCKCYTYNIRCHNENIM